MLKADEELKANFARKVDNCDYCGDYTCPKHSKLIKKGNNTYDTNVSDWVDAEVIDYENIQKSDIILKIAEMVGADLDEDIKYAQYYPDRANGMKSTGWQYFYSYFLNDGEIDEQ